MRGAPHVWGSQQPSGKSILELRSMSVVSDGPPDFGDQLPVQAESCLVPTHHGFGRDRNEGLLPSGPESADGDPEELIEEAEDRPWTAPLQHRELLPEREILQEEMPTTAQRANKRSEQTKAD